MKKIYVAVLITLLTIMGLMACANKTDSASKTNDNAKEGYIFDANGLDIMVDAKASSIIESLGEPISYFEAASCAFNGLDKIYTYAGYEITTYTDSDVDYISEISLKDDTVTTMEGIYIGSDMDSVIAAYGDNYKEDAGYYIYTKGNTRLTFVVTDGEVTAIRYNTMVFDEN